MNCIWVKWRMTNALVDAISFIQIRAQCFVKLADQIVFVLNQLMGFSFALSSLEIRVCMLTSEPTFGRSGGPLLKVCG